MSEELALKPRIKIKWFIWTLLAFFIFVVIAGYSSRMARNYTDYDQKRVAERYATLNKLRQEEHKTLTTVDWVNQDKKTIHIPIDEAMAKEIDTLKNKPAAVGAAIPIAAPAVPAAPAPAVATNAAPVPSPAPKKETK